MVPALLVPTVYDLAISAFMFMVPLYLMDRGVDPVVMGSLLAIPSLMQMIVRIPAGLVASRFGNSWAMLFGCTAAAAAALFPALAPAAGLIAFMSVAQVLSGSGRAAFWPANQAHVMGLFKERGVALIGFYNFLITGGAMAGPPLAALLMHGAGYDGAFLALAALTAAPGLLLVATRAGFSPSADGGAHTLREFARQAVLAAANRRVWLAGLIFIAHVVPAAMAASFLPVLLREHGASTARISVLMTVRVGAVALFSLASARFAVERHRAALTLATGIIGAIAMAATPALAASPLVALPMAAYGLVAATTLNVQMAESAEAVRPEIMALGMAIAGAIGGTALTGIPIALGYLAKAGRLEAGFGLCGLFLLAVSLWASYVFWRRGGSSLRSSP
jgi:predicted MFS family arabinose efflux permease